MLFGSTMLEIAIGMIFVYILMSLLCSALAEFIESLAKRRAKDLEKGIARLLGSQKLTRDFFNHPVIKPMFEGRKPSYIPARTFSLALWNMATAAAEGTPASVAGVTKDINVLRATITMLPPDSMPEGLRGTLVTLIDEAGGDFERARANVEGWYNDAMDRISGAFKRRTHWILIALGFLLAIALNVDSINIVKALSHNEELRKTVVAAAENYANAPLPGTTPTPSPSPTPTPTPTPTNTPAATTPTSPAAGTPSPPPAATATPKSLEEQFQEASERIDNIRGKLNELGLPIGWVFAPDRDDVKYYNDTEKKQFNKALYDSDMKAYMSDPRHTPSGDELPTKTLGLLLTAFAVSQGAPFWFDLLNKIIVIRSTVKPHEKSQDQPSKDRPAPDTSDEAPEGIEEGKD